MKGAFMQETEKTEAMEKSCDVATEKKKTKKKLELKAILKSLKSSWEIIRKKLVKAKLLKEKVPGEERLPVVRVGVSKKSVYVLWGILIFSVFFAVYKNFTAIDKETIHETEVVKEKLLNTDAIENFVKDFAETYYTWNNDKDSIDQRATAVGSYLTDDLAILDKDTIRSDIPTSSVVTGVQIWNVEQKTDGEYTVTYSVTQQVTEENHTSTAKSFYTVVVHQDDAGDLVIVRNPTIRAAVGKSSYAPQTTSSDGSVDAAETDEITDFLETFFSLYPSAGEKELAYYVKDSALEPVNNDSYIFSELVNPVFVKEGEQVQVTVTVEYLDQATKATQLSQFNLTLQKDDNWMIVDSE